MYPLSIFGEALKPFIKINFCHTHPDSHLLLSQYLRQLVSSLSSYSLEVTIDLSCATLESTMSSPLVSRWSNNHLPLTFSLSGFCSDGLRISLGTGHDTSGNHPLVVLLPALCTHSPSRFFLFSLALSRQVSRSGFWGLTPSTCRFGDTSGLHRTSNRGFNFPVLSSNALSWKNEEHLVDIPNFIFHPNLHFAQKSGLSYLVFPYAHLGVFPSLLCSLVVGGLIRLFHVFLSRQPWADQLDSIQSWIESLRSSDLLAKVTSLLPVPIIFVARSSRKTDISLLNSYITSTSTMYMFCLVRAPTMLHHVVAVWIIRNTTNTMVESTTGRALKQRVRNGLGSSHNPTCLFGWEREAR
jgi:hypothetical protein